MDGSKAVLSGAFPGCVNGSGVFDMSGNVSEWTASDGEVATIHGGSFVSGRFSSCKNLYTLSKTERYVFNGVRCCTQPIAAETGSPP
jgi:formylglycine-generating enzyme required for sulfatase activity